jgi:hypothetical protein
LIFFVPQQSILIVAMQARRRVAPGFLQREYASQVPMDERQLAENFNGGAVAAAATGMSSTSVARMAPQTNADVHEAHATVDEIQDQVVNPSPPPAPSSPRSSQLGSELLILLGAVAGAALFVANKK